MKKKLTYRDKLLELAYIYNVKEIQDYVKRRKDLTTGQIELILKKTVGIYQWAWACGDKYTQNIVITINGNEASAKRNSDEFETIFEKIRDAIENINNCLLNTSLK